MARYPVRLTNYDADMHWVRLQTLTRVRWIAVLGQFLAITIAHFGLGLSFSIPLAYLVVAVSIASNLLSEFVFPPNRRLSEGEVLLTLIFDTTQLSVLLFLTGGLSNPFALLLLAPVTIAATALRLRSTLAIGGIAAALASLLAVSHEPLILRGGLPVVIPTLLLVGQWLAILTGIAFIGLYSRSVAIEKHALTEALLATQMALAREQKLTDLTAVVAAAAHELGTPLATIKLASSELIDTLEDADQRADATLIREQADRCRKILHSMGQAGKDDPHLHQAPLEAVVTEAAAPHAARGKELRFVHRALGDADPRMPEIWRRPEIIHGLRNLIQNAVDFAENRIRIDAEWDESTIRLRVMDDGPGYPPDLLGRIGDPYLRARRPAALRSHRPEYEGMGLGLFIAKTLLERSGARLRFRNGTGSAVDDGDHAGEWAGAIAEVSWPRTAIVAAPRPRLGANLPLDPSIGGSSPD
ncbi:sensor histidine kinase RegB [Pararhodobacter sp. SW119]|uniref:sensor histidine kinase RegB n=1 Tax=Pararhodobacter sp. SW119 TaxID=2780075 RepID=UPI001FD74A9B|nr:ActS/PrrB/RegB family redox-sensitive histidine kinase [Pararhodobacter sp. SW119]